MADVIIIGGGPAGMTAALNILRTGRSVLILERNAFGGQMALSPRLENIPGIKMIGGLDLANQLFDQILDLGAQFELEDVIKVEKFDQRIKVTTDYHEYTSSAVIFANGCSHRTMGLPNEEELTGHGVSYCAVCDGAFFINHEAYVVGDANSALQYALLLGNYCPKVHIMALFDHLFADNILIDRVNNNEKFDITYDVSLKELISENGELTAIKFINTKTNEEKIYKTNNVFIAIGQIPHNDKFKNLINLDDKGFIITNENMETNIPGIFAIGDTRSKVVRQVSTAMGDASNCAVFVDRYLRSLK